MFGKPPKESKTESLFERVLLISGIENRVFSFLPSKEWRQASRITQGFYQVNQDKLIWRERYQQDFGPIIFEDDYREQYIAMHLFRLANNKRKDKADYYCNQLIEFIEKNKKDTKETKDKDEVKPWIAFFMGALYYLKSDYSIDPSTADCYLTKAIAKEDYRAAQFVVFTARTAGYATLDNLINDECLAVLKKAYEKGFTPVAREIGYFYEMLADKTMANQEVLTQAKNWFLKYLETHNDLNVANSFAVLFARENGSFYMNNLATDSDEEIDSDNEEEYEPEPELEQMFNLSELNKQARLNAIQALEKHWESFPSGAVACQIGVLYYKLEESTLDFSKSKLWFERGVALQNGRAGRWLANITFNLSDDFNKREELYQQAFQNGEIDLAQQIVSWLIINKDNNKACNWLKKGFLAGDTDSAKNLSHIFLEEKGWENNPAKVCWVQAAVQCKDSKSITSLINKMGDNNFCNYATCAIAIVYELGFLKPTGANKFNVPQTLIEKLNWDILEKYQNALQQEGLLEPYVADVFVKWKQEFEKVRGQVLTVDTLKACSR